MRSRIPIILLALVIAALISLLPIFPLLTEGRAIAQTGETLYQEWRFVTLADFNDAMQFARLAWWESVWGTYVVMVAVNYLALLAISWILASQIVRIAKRALRR